jgi:hypothetical protein
MRSEEKDCSLIIYAESWIEICGSEKNLIKFTKCTLSKYIKVRIDVSDEVIINLIECYANIICYNYSKRFDFSFFVLQN